MKREERERLDRPSHCGIGIRRNYPWRSWGRVRRGQPGKKRCKEALSIKCTHIEQQWGTLFLGEGGEQGSVKSTSREGVGRSLPASGGNSIEEGGKGKVFNH